jgi:adenylate cyclase
MMSRFDYLTITVTSVSDPTLPFQALIVLQFALNRPLAFYYIRRGAKYMANDRTKRRLAAILVADVVGYSALIRADEEGTRAAFRQHNQVIIEPQITSHNGRIFKTVGDGFLAEFASVVDAVRCAVEIQNAIKNHNTDVVADKRIEFRIGVNLGDVIAEGDDLHGDGVNVAARLEGLANPRGICISGSAFEQVRDKLGVGFEDLGDQQVKNIGRPVRAYRVLTDSSDAGKILTAPTKGFTRWRIPAIVAALVVIIAAGGLAWQLSWGTRDEAPAPGRSTVSDVSAYVSDLGLG